MLTGRSAIFGMSGASRSDTCSAFVEELLADGHPAAIVDGHDGTDDQSSPVSMPAAASASSHDPNRITYVADVNQPSSSIIDDDSRPS